MRAIVYKEPGPIDRADSLIEIELPDPVATGRDLLVEVKAVSVNPVDVKVRAGSPPLTGDSRILGWDAAGIVRAVGPDVRDFRPGDHVYYAGLITRPGSNAQLQLVDERIVGRMPRSLDWAQAAALPLTAITAWEALFDRIEVNRPVPGTSKTILIIGGAGGVGSIAIQLARKLTNLTVIATASRDETRDWALEMGAHHVVDHSRPLAEAVAALDLGAPAFVLSTTHTEQHLAEIAALMAPQGRFVLIDDPKTLDVNPFKRKAISTHWELMFTRPLFETADMDKQGMLLNEVSRLVDGGVLATTLTEQLSPIGVDTLKQAHALVESGTMRGKLVLHGWD